MKTYGIYAVTPKTITVKDDKDNGWVADVKWAFAESIKPERKLELEHLPVLKGAAADGVIKLEVRFPEYSSVSDLRRRGDKAEGRSCNHSGFRVGRMDSRTEQQGWLQQMNQIKPVHLGVVAFFCGVIVGVLSVTLPNIQPPTEPQLVTLTPAQHQARLDELLDINAQLVSDLASCRGW